MDINNMDFWQEKYLQNSTGWDLGEIAPPLKQYFDQLDNKEIKILIPGAGNAYEAEYLHQQGFSNVYVADWASKAIENLKARLPDFPKQHLLIKDFFQINESFDLIIEQTFFCALTPNLREAYVQKMAELIRPKGKLVGLLFQIEFNRPGPPFGGNKEEYIQLFTEKFTIQTMETSTNSIAPRQENELFVILQKK